MATISPHLAVLLPAQRGLWPALAPASALGLVLYGGTAIALRLGHRASLDFDFFTERSLDKDALRAALPFIAQATILQDRPDTFTVLTSGQAPGDQVKVSFFGMITFGRVGEPDMTSDHVAQVASLNDLMATKLKVLLQRVEAKDYLDIATLITSGTPLDTGVAGARALFGPHFQPSECLKALVYFQGGDLDTLPADTRTVLIDTVSAVETLPEVPIISHTLAAVSDAI